MADEDDAVPFLGETPKDGEDLLGLLGCQHGGWLVEHEDPGIAIEGLEDLDPLLPADGQRSNLCLRVDLEPEPLAELDDPAVRLLAVEEDRPGHRLLAEQDVLGNREDGDEHEVLMDHVDPARDCVRRAGDRRLPAVEQDYSLVRSGKAVEDIHQRRLAGAVLAEQRVDLAWPDLEVDVIVGDDARVALRDAAHLERGRDHRRFGRRRGFDGHDRLGRGR